MIERSESGTMITGDDITSGHYWRWTWEYVNALGYRCTDTVRLVP